MTVLDEILVGVREDLSARQAGTRGGDWRHRGASMAARKARTLPSSPTNSASAISAPCSAWWRFISPVAGDAAAARPAS